MLAYVVNKTVFYNKIGINNCIGVFTNYNKAKNKVNELVNIELENNYIIDDDSTYITELSNKNESIVIKIDLVEVE